MPGCIGGFPGMVQSRGAKLCIVTEPAVRAVCSITTGFCWLCGTLRTFTGGVPLSLTDVNLHSKLALTRIWCSFGVPTYKLSPFPGLSGNYRNHCPGFTEMRVREFPKPAAVT